MQDNFTPHGSVVRFVEANYDRPVSGPCVIPPFSQRQGRIRIAVRGRRRAAHAYATELRNGPAPKGMVSCHNCREPNCIIHTRWDTVAANNADMIRDGTQPRGATGRRKLSEQDVRMIRVMLADGVRQRTIAGWFRIEPMSVSRINTNQAWRWLQ